MERGRSLRQFENRAEPMSAAELRRAEEVARRVHDQAA
jgi:hypothetical protein